MREIKFRVWNGMEMVYDVTVGKFGTFYVNPSNNGLDEKDSASLTPFTTKYHKDTPVMQFTGLKDKNGKEIYEGDIVMSEGQQSRFIQVVEFHNSPETCGRGWVGVNKIQITLTKEGKKLYEHLERFSYFSWPFSCEVIGNIYSNPELLQDKEVKS
jgi:uncharacterized phage protein (TIGR01671 family)